jgi:hypothetical protein
MMVLICDKCKALYYAFNETQKHYCYDFLNIEREDLKFEPDRVKKIEQNSIL